MILFRTFIKKALSFFGFKRSQICKNCALYNKKHNVCSVVIIDKGDEYQMPVKPNDKCYWAENGIEISVIRSWSDGKHNFMEFPKD